MTLKEYIDNVGVSQAALARKIGVEQASISRWVNGKQYPDWSLIPEIYKATEGRVTANDFVNYDE